ncbi:hypothetical protein C1752_01863 [Acaryochloris thomasi RCC1774]|uniref:Uncharacterized protein n=1 Tax=Acaryochloris thomasi RCC1774 TaxID=1764569 RepID=A0A2W1JKX5_9CYAN|nr:hypothetical protein [Acaryochloris thomasi]PZD74019.1 hypothetical protein C1752_01863 [Acaryochloris thomasi RCC1774]
MQTIKTKAQINTDRTLTVQLPADLQVGEYDVVVVLDKSSKKQVEPHILQAVEEVPLADRWEQWFDEVEKLPLKENVEEQSFHEILVEKYRKQGLEL